jgi:hypothetical protein
MLFIFKRTFFKFFRQPCPWDITLSRLRETEIELEEKTKLDHSFVSDGFERLTRKHLVNTIIPHL